MVLSLSTLPITLIQLSQQQRLVCAEVVVNASIPQLLPFPENDDFFAGPDESVCVVQDRFRPEQYTYQSYSLLKKGNYVVDTSSSHETINFTHPPNPIG